MTTLQREDTVLIVDDNLDSCASLAMLVMLEGYNAVTAANGLEALEYLRRHGPPRFIILDMMMPVMAVPGLQARACRIRCHPGVRRDRARRHARPGRLSGHRLRRAQARRPRKARGHAQEVRPTALKCGCLYRGGSPAPYSLMAQHLTVAIHQRAAREPVLAVNPFVSRKPRVRGVQWTADLINSRVRVPLGLRKGTGR